MKAEKITDGVWEYRGSTIVKNVMPSRYYNLVHHKHAIYKDDKQITHRDTLEKSIKFIDDEIR